MEKYFSFVREKDSYIAGATYVVAVNVVLCLLTSPLIFIAKYLDFSTNIGLIFFIIYFFNINTFGKHVFILTGLKLVKTKIRKMDIGALVSSLILAIGIAVISINKFDLLPSSGHPIALFLFLSIVTIFIVSFAGLTGSNKTFSDASLTMTESNAFGDKSYIKKKTFIKLNVVVLSISMLVGIIFFNVVFLWK